MGKGEIEMATAPTCAPWTVDELLAAVKQLPPTHRREFQRQLAAWSGQNNEPSRASRASSPPRDEEALLSAIRENSALPLAEQRCFNRLRRKRQAGTLTEAEEQQLQGLWREVEQMNAVRLEALSKLADRRGIDVRTVMHQLGLSENRDVF
jgi:hypothetical protein